MNSHKRWAQKMMAKPMPLTVELEQQAADRERRRIRRAQRDALTTLWALSQQVSAPIQEVGPNKVRASITVKLLFDVYYVIEGATRAKKGKRK